MTDEAKQQSASVVVEVAADCRVDDRVTAGVNGILRAGSGEAAWPDLEPGTRFEEM